MFDKYLFIKRKVVIGLLSLTLLILLSGCSTISSNVTRFHNSEALKLGKAFIMLPFDYQKDSLEYKSYARLISSKLETHGYKPTTQKNNADYVVYFQYGIDNGKIRYETNPIYGQIGGGSTTHHTGSINNTYGGYSSYSGTSYTAPQFGIVGSSMHSYVIYTRFLTLNILNLQNKNKVFEGKVISSGGSNSFTAVSRCLIEALFKDFPGKDAETINITLYYSECSDKKNKSLPSK